MIVAQTTSELCRDGQDVAESQALGDWIADCAHFRTALRRSNGRYLDPMKLLVMRKEAGLAGVALARLDVQIVH
jgi:hypothetical protein